MNCEECSRLDRSLLESIAYADRAETSLRCFLITHQHVAGVSDLDAYQALRAEQLKTSDQRHEAFVKVISHRKQHG